MDLAQLAKIIKNYIEKIVSVSNFKETPGASYILNKMLSLEATKRLVKATLSNKEIVELSYIIFFMFKGDDVETAIWRSENELYVLSLTEVGESYNEDVECPECAGAGTIACEECEGTGSEGCWDCDASGESSSSSEDNPENCNDCDGSGEINCSSCEGDEEVTCPECSGNGEVEAGEETVHFDSSVWAISDVNMYEKLGDLEGEYIHTITDILDSNKGSIVLLKAESEVDTEDMFEFEETYGPYHELKGASKVEYIRPFDEVNSDNFRDQVNGIKYVGY
jgi:RecJ-like exonuclease